MMHAFKRKLNVELKNRRHQSKLENYASFIQCYYLFMEQRQYKGI